MEGPYRVGNHSPINIWHEAGGYRTGDQIAVGMSPEWAALIVTALNQHHAAAPNQTAADDETPVPIPAVYLSQAVGEHRPQWLRPGVLVCAHDWVYWPCPTVSTGPDQAAAEPMDQPPFEVGQQAMRHSGEVFTVGNVSRSGTDWKVYDRDTTFAFYNWATDLRPVTAVMACTEEDIHPEDWPDCVPCGGMGKVRPGARPVVDSELRDRIAEVGREASGTTEGSQQFAPIYWDDVASDIHDRVVAPVLAAQEQRFDDRLQAMKNESDQLLAEATVEAHVADASFRYIRLQLAEMLDADEETNIPELLEEVKAELDLRFATRQQYAEERDAAQAAIRDIDAHATPVGLLHEDDPEGSPHHYLVTVGALHRALGKSNGTGVKCDVERDVLRWLHAEARYHRDVAHRMLERLETEHVTWTVEGSTEEVHPDWCRECRVDKLRAELDRAHRYIGNQLVESWRGQPVTEATEQAGGEQGDKATAQADPRWRTHPGTGVMHLVRPGTTRAVCNAAESYAWRASADGNARHVPCVEIAELAVSPATPTEPRVWTSADQSPPLGTQVSTRLEAKAKRRLAKLQRGGT